MVNSQKSRDFGVSAQFYQLVGIVSARNKTSQALLWIPDRLAYLRKY
jgi:hypothetical protein